MNEEAAKMLRAPFVEEAVGYLPRVTCRACSENKAQKHCDRHTVQRCEKCNNWITTAHIDLDYVGHADVTARLLEVDPQWSWEPIAFDQQGLPALDGSGGLWIRLTVCGVTRPGYGDADGRKGGDATKTAIGDALRNAAMRFGVALDLWMKGDRTAASTFAEPVTEPQRPAQGQSRPPAAPATSQPPTAKKELWEYVQSLGWSATKSGEEFEKWSKAGDADSVGIQITDATDEQVRQFLSDLRAEAQAA